MPRRRWARDAGWRRARGAFDDMQQAGMFLEAEIVNQFAG